MNKRLYYEIAYNLLLQPMNYSIRDFQCQSHPDFFYRTHSELQDRNLTMMKIGYLIWCSIVNNETVEFYYTDIFEEEPTRKIYSFHIQEPTGIEDKQIIDVYCFLLDLYEREALPKKIFPSLKKYNKGLPNEQQFTELELILYLNINEFEKFQSSNIGFDGTPWEYGELEDWQKEMISQMKEIRDDTKILRSVQTDEPFNHLIQDMLLVTHHGFFELTQAAGYNNFSESIHPVSVARFFDEHKSLLIKQNGTPFENLHEFEETLRQKNQTNAARNWKKRRNYR